MKVTEKELAVIIRKLVEERVNGRDRNLNKIRSAINGETKIGADCHGYTGNKIRKRQDPEDFIVLCGMNKDTIFHSYLVDKTGRNLIGRNSGYSNSSIDISDPKPIVKFINNGVYGPDIIYPYIELIEVSDFINYK